MKEVLVVITYIAGESQGHELAIAVAGWRRHFKHPHKIVVIGDKPPRSVTVDKWLYIDRVPEKDGEYRPHLDICTKLEFACFMFGDKYPGFIWASDDCFPINDFTLEDVMTPKFQDDEMPSKGQNHFNPWWRNLVKTRKLCEEEGFGVVNWATHLPLYFRVSELINTIWEYHLETKSFVIENIIYNRFKQEGMPIKLHEGDTWKHTVCYTPLDRQGLYEAFARVKFVCASVNGWSYALEEELKNHFEL